MVYVVSSTTPHRRPPRIDVAINASLTTSDRVTFPVAIRDISASGFRVEALAPEEFVVGEVVTITVPGEECLRGEIKWTAGRFAGASLIL